MSTIYIVFEWVSRNVDIFVNQTFNNTQCKSFCFQEKTQSSGFKPIKSYNIQCCPAIGHVLGFEPKTQHINYKRILDLFLLIIL